MKLNAIRILIFMLAGTLLSCTHSKIISSWSNPKKPEKVYTSLLVTALTANTAARATVETDMAQALSKYSITVYKGIDEFPPTLLGDSLTKETLSLKVKQKKIDGLLTISLVRKDEKEKYVPGTYPPVVVYGHHRHFWIYYNYWYPYGYNPGYYITEKIYYIETNFYDSATEELVWTAQSRTYNPIDLTSFSKEFVKLIVDKLIADGILKQSTISKN